MRMLLPLLATLAVFTFLQSSEAIAAPVPYIIDVENSDVSFSYTVEGVRFSGNFPDFAANLVLDFESVAASSVDVTIQTRTATGGFGFATDALRGPEILDADTFPTIVFRSSKVSTYGQQIRLSGAITIKGVTRPIALTAQLFRPAGSQEDERENLTIKMTGQIDRNAFGVTGFKTLVGNVIQIEVTARIKKKNRP